MYDETIGDLKRKISQRSGVPVDKLQAFETPLPESRMHVSPPLPAEARLERGRLN